MNAIVTVLSCGENKKCIFTLTKQGSVDKRTLMVFSKDFVRRDPKESSLFINCRETRITSEITNAVLNNLHFTFDTLYNVSHWLRYGNR